MKPELKEKLIARFGIDKAIKIINAIEESNKKYELAGIAVHERFERMIFEMMPKDKLEDGAWYIGHRERGSHVAQWDEKKQLFNTINFTIGQHYLEEINHLSDELNTNIDGFMPFEKINPIIIN